MGMHAYLHIAIIIMICTDDIEIEIVPYAAPSEPLSVEIQGVCYCALCDVEGTTGQWRKANTQIL